MCMFWHEYGHTKDSKPVEPWEIDKPVPIRAMLKMGCKAFFRGPSGRKWNCTKLATAASSLLLPDTYSLRLLTYRHLLLKLASLSPVLYLINMLTFHVVPCSMYPSSESTPSSNSTYPLHISVCLSFLHALTVPSQGSRTQVGKLQQDFNHCRLRRT